MTDVTVIGNIAQPELKFAKDNKPFARFNLAENHRKQVNGQWVDDGTTWRRVTVWGDLAEAFVNTADKGARVIVVGTERLEEWTDKDGNKRQSLVVSAKHLGVVPARLRNEPQQDWFGDQPRQDWSNNQWGQPRFEQGEAPF